MPSLSGHDATTGSQSESDACGQQMHEQEGPKQISDDLGLWPDELSNDMIHHLVMHGPSLF